MVTTYPFGISRKTPLEILLNNGIKPELNNLERKYSREEHRQKLSFHKPEIIIAGTENYDRETLDIIPQLKMISRVGIGLDSVDLDECKKRGIVVAYTPDAPSNAVAELAICQMLNMLRHVQKVSEGILAWPRFAGKEIRSCNVGIIGMGRIGNLVLDKLQGLKPRRIFVNDIIKDRAINRPRSEFATKDEIIAECDIVTIHIPLNEKNRDFISEKDFLLMKKDICLMNLSRGGIINENDAYTWFKDNKEATIAIDTFEEEPYNGALVRLPNSYLTPHLGSMSVQSRFGMETGAAEAVINFINNKPIINRVI